VGPDLLTAFLPHGRHAGELLQAGRVRIAGGIVAEGHQQPGSEGGAGPWQLPEELGGRMRRKRRRDAGFQGEDVFLQHANELHQASASGASPG